MFGNFEALFQSMYNDRMGATVLGACATVSALLHINKTKAKQLLHHQHIIRYKYGNMFLVGGISG